MIRATSVSALGAAAGLVVALALPASGQDTGEFVLTQGGNQIGSETFTRSAELLETELRVTGQGTIATVATLGDAAMVDRVELRILPPGDAGAEPLQTLAAEFRGDSVFVEQPIGTAGATAGAGAGTIPYINPSPSYLEQIVRRARSLDGSDVTVQIWAPGPNGGQVAPAPVTCEGDRATLTLGAVTINITTDADGRLLGAEVPAQGLTIERQ